MKINIEHKGATQKIAFEKFGNTIFCEMALKKIRSIR